MSFVRVLMLAFAAALIGVLSIAPAAAEETRQAGEYRIAVRFADERVQSEVATALVVRITDGAGRPVEGLEQVLRVDVFAENRAQARTQQLPLRPTRGEPGSYDAVFVPPSAGHYEFLVSGQLPGRTIDEWFATGTPGLPDVAPQTSFEFGSPGSYIAYGLLVVYLLGLVVIAVKMRWRRRVVGVEG